MTKDNLHNAMSKIYEDASSNKSNESIRTAIMKAVQLGMQYNEELIKEGMNVVFESLHKK